MFSLCLVVSHDRQVGFRLIGNSLKEWMREWMVVCVCMLVYLCDGVVTCRGGAPPIAQCPLWLVPPATPTSSIDNEQTYCLFEWTHPLSSQYSGSLIFTHVWRWVPRLNRAIQSWWTFSKYRDVDVDLNTQHSSYPQSVTQCTEQYRAHSLCCSERHPERELVLTPLSGTYTHAPRFTRCLCRQVWSLQGRVCVCVVGLFRVFVMHRICSMRHLHSSYGKYLYYYYCKPGRTCVRLTHSHLTFTTQWRVEYDPVDPWESGVKGQLFPPRSHTSVCKV